MQSCDGQTINVIVFGGTDAGKSAVVNLVAQRQVAKPLSHAHSYLLDTTRYDVSFDGMNYRIFEAVGLEEPKITTGGYLKALEKAHEFVAKLDAAGGVHLLLFVVEAGKVTATTQNNYRLFFETILQTEVPMLLVFTGLEQEVEMEDWWRRNKTDIERHGFKNCGHACISAIRGNNPGEDVKYMESQKKIRDLLKDCHPRTSAFRPDPDSWLARLAINMQSFIKKERKPKRRDVENVLTKRLKLSPGKAQRLLDMMEQEHVERGTGESEGRPLVRTEGEEGVADASMPRSTTLEVAHQQADTPREFDNTETNVLISAHDLTGQITKTHILPFAAGSYGDIYKCRWNTDGRWIVVAIKTHRLFLQDDELLLGKMEQFRREIAVWLRLEHPNVLPLLGVAKDLGMNPHLPALVYPWVDNGDLSTFLEKHVDTTLAQRLALICDVAHGLQYLHSQHIIHGSLSGSNVLVYADGRACITDHGSYTLLTKLRGPTVASRDQDRGIVRWAAPELFPLNDLHVAPTMQSDVYSFGCIMLQILTGDIPYHYLRREEQVIIAVATGGRPERPDHTMITDNIWNFVEWCWSPLNSAKPRPSTDQIVEFTDEELAAVMLAA